jgi:hypothetical protein
VLTVTQKLQSWSERRSSGDIDLNMSLCVIQVMILEEMPNRILQGEHQIFGILKLILLRVIVCLEII